MLLVETLGDTKRDIMASIIQVRVDDELKLKGFPFEIKKTVQNPYIALSEDKILQKLETSRKHAEQGKHRDAGDVISDMRAKYGI